LIAPAATLRRARRRFPRARPLARFFQPLQHDHFVRRAFASVAVRPFAASWMMRSLAASTQESFRSSGIVDALRIIIFHPKEITPFNFNSKLPHPHIHSFERRAGFSLIKK
jgi:hypothetical protein